MENALEIAYEYIKKKGEPVPFLELFDEVVKRTDMPVAWQRRKRSVFYGDLSIDTRFKLMDGNAWDLSKRYTYEEKHKGREDFDDMCSDDDEEEIYKSDEYEVESDDDVEPDVEKVINRS